MDYRTARESLGLSREAVSSMARRAGIKISATSLKKLEDEGAAATNGRGITVEAVTYINYLFGMGEVEPTDWTQVEKGAPVLVLGEKKKSFHFVARQDDGSVQVFGDSFRSFNQDRVRLVAPTALPPIESAGLFETRSRGTAARNGDEVMSYVEKNPDIAHGIGSIAYAVGKDNATVSRAVTALVAAGRLTKVKKGTVTLPPSAEI
jgi:hypothetical protein